MATYFKVEPWWPDETVFIIGGGPSLKNFDLTGIKKHKVITVNNAFRLVQPDILFFADARWWRWNKEDIPLEYPGRILSCQKVADHLADPRVCRMNRDYRFANGGEALSHDKSMLSGPDGGYMAINLAVLLGVSRIVLLGFDMGFQESPDGEAHWHPDHPVKSNETDYTNIFAPKYPALIKAVEKLNIEVLRCTPSRLEFIKQIPFQEALALPPRRRKSIS